MATGYLFLMVLSYCMNGVKIVIFMFGLVVGMMKDVVDEIDELVGVVNLTLFWLFLYEVVREVLVGVDYVIVLERAFAPGAGGIVFIDVLMALAGLFMKVSMVVAGFGGCFVIKASIQSMFA